MQKLPLVGYKSLILAVVVAIFGAMQTFDWSTIVPPQDTGPIMIGIGAAIAILRTLTTTPVGKQ